MTGSGYLFHPTVPIGHSVKMFTQHLLQWYILKCKVPTPNLIERSFPFSMCSFETDSRCITRVCVLAPYIVLMFWKRATHKPLPLKIDHKWKQGLQWGFLIPVQEASQRGLESALHFLHGACRTAPRRERYHPPSRTSDGRVAQHLKTRETVLLLSWVFFNTFSHFCVNEIKTRWLREITSFIACWLEH